MIQCKLELGNKFVIESVLKFVIESVLRALHSARCPSRSVLQLSELSEK